MPGSQNCTNMICNKLKQPTKRATTDIGRLDSLVVESEVEMSTKISHSECWKAKLTETHNKPTQATQGLSSEKGYRW